METLEWQEGLTWPASGKTCFPRSHIHVPSLARRRRTPLIRTTSFPLAGRLPLLFGMLAAFEADSTCGKAEADHIALL